MCVFWSHCRALTHHISGPVQYTSVYNTHHIYGPVNCICDVMVGMLALSAVDHGFEPRSGQTKDYKIGICCFSTKHAALTKKEQRDVGLETG